MYFIFTWKGGFPLSRNWTFVHAREFFKFSKCVDGLRHAEKVERASTIFADTSRPCICSILLLKVDFYCRVTLRRFKGVNLTLALHVRKIKLSNVFLAFARLPESRHGILTVA